MTYNMNENKVVADYIKALLSHLNPGTLAWLLADLEAVEFDYDLRQEIWNVGAYIEGEDAFEARYESAA
jgi:hypothetical protein